MKELKQNSIPLGIETLSFQRHSFLKYGRIPSRWELKLVLFDREKIFEYSRIPSRWELKPDDIYAPNATPGVEFHPVGN